MIGVTIFATVINQFMQVFLTVITSSSTKTSNEDNLTRWFSMIKRIRMQPLGEGTDISVELKEEIENHFRHFWENDRVSTLLEKKQYFDSIPHKIQEHVMCSFLFSDILYRPAFQDFFRGGSDFDSRFIYEVSFGFMPRDFNPTASDRYIFEEEGDVTEIYFIIKGDWAIAFDSFAKNDMQGFSLEGTEEETVPADLARRGIVVAL